MFFQENGQYRCAVYLRLSRSDGDQQESNSIKNQRALLNDYLGKHPELHKVDEYVDDGYSGTNFERPDFKRMMQDIENRKINCIIVKDLSRFGRNYIETGRYLERIFPFMGVRFIAINDHYDSAEDNDDKYNSCWNWTLVPHHRRQQFIHYQVFCAVQTAGRI